MESTWIATLIDVTPIYATKRDIPTAERKVRLRLKCIGGRERERDREISRSEHLYTRENFKLGSLKV